MQVYNEFVYYVRSTMHGTQKVCMLTLRPVPIGLTDRGWDIRKAVLTFWSAYSSTKMFEWICSLMSNLRQVDIGSGNDLTPTSRYGITWRNTDPVSLTHTSIYICHRTQYVDADCRLILGTGWPGVATQKGETSYD